MKVEVTPVRSAQNERVVDFGDFASDGVGVLAGRPRGKACREKANLNQYDQEPSVIVRLVAPESITSISSSFLLAFLGPSIRKLGVDEFRKKYILEGEQVRDAFEYSLLVAPATESEA